MIDWTGRSTASVGPGDAVPRIVGSVEGQLPCPSDRAGGGQQADWLGGGHRPHMAHALFLGRIAGKGPR